MGKILKYIAAILGVVILLFVGTLFVISIAVDPNSFKPQISELVKNHTGRDLSIQGDIGLNLYPNVELTVANASLSNIQGFGKKPFFKVRNAEVGVELLPLFSKELNIQKISLDGVRLNLSKNKKGETNWSDLLEPGQSGRKGKRQSPAKPEFQSPNPIQESKDLLKKPKQAPAYLAGFGLGELVLTDAEIELDDKKANKRMLLEDIELNVGKVVPGANTPISFKMSLNGVKSPQDSQVRLSTVLKLKEDFNGVELNNLNLSVAGQKIGGNFVVSDTSKRVMTFNLDSAQLNLDHIDRVLSEFGRASRIPREKSSKGRKSNNDLESKQSENSSATPGAAASTATSIATATASMPQKAPRDLNINGSVTVNNIVVANLKLQNFAMDVRAKKNLIEMDPITATAYNGKYKGKVVIDERGARPVVTVTESLLGLQSEPFLTDFLKKPSKFTGKLNASGTATADPKTPLETLNGSFRVEFLDGAVKDTNIPHLLRATRAKLKGEPTPPDEKKQTDFSILTASGKIKDGIVTSDDLLAKAPLLRINGKGSVNLVNETLDYFLTAVLVKSLEGQGGEELKDLVGIPVPIQVAGAIEKPNYKVDLGKLIKETGGDEIKKRALEKLQKKLDKKGLGDLLKF